VHVWSKLGACGVFVEDDGSFCALLLCAIYEYLLTNRIVFINRGSYIRGSISSILRYDPLTNITCGYMITDFNYFDLSRRMDLSFFPAQFLACPHPILLSILAIEQTVAERSISLDKVYNNLVQVEQMTGFTVDEQIKSEKLDFPTMVRRLGETHLLFSNIDNAMRALEIAVVMFKRKLEYMDGDVSTDAMREKLSRYVPRLRDRIDYLQSMIQHLLLYSNMSARLQVQQQVLFNLIAQEDTKVNIGLAKDSREIAAASRQDSSAMKIIAMLTTLFLPGTFIAVSLTIHHLLT
jgi:hypothetical protein